MLGGEGDGEIKGLLQMIATKGKQTHSYTSACTHTHILVRLAHDVQPDKVGHAEESWLNVRKEKKRGWGEALLFRGAHSQKTLSRQGTKTHLTKQCCTVLRQKHPSRISTSAFLRKERLFLRNAPGL